MRGEGGMPRVFPLGCLKKSCQEGRICRPVAIYVRARGARGSNGTANAPFTNDESRPLIEAVKRGINISRFRTRMPKERERSAQTHERNSVVKHVPWFLHHGPRCIKSTTVHSVGAILAEVVFAVCSYARG